MERRTFRSAGFFKQEDNIERYNGNSQRVGFRRGGFATHNIQVRPKLPTKETNESKRVNGPSLSPKNLAHVKGILDPHVRRVYPTRFDLRNLRKLSPVKDQGDRNDCWIHATLASLESSLMPKEKVNFSVRHMGTSTGFDAADGMGGNYYMSAAILARWDGPVTANDYRQARQNRNTVSPTPHKHVQQVIFLPNRSHFTDNDTIKYFITTHGALYADIHKEKRFYNETHHSFYCNRPMPANHAISVVGWDDDYPAENFTIRPRGNGAFILRNSYGTSWGDGGYFYLSYYDCSFRSGASFNNADSVEEYTWNYQYDLLGNTGNTGFFDLEGWGANVFTAINNDPLKAVSFYTNDANVSYEISIYTGVSQNNPINGNRVLTQKGRKIYPGYYTERLEIPVPLKEGDTFSVVIKFLNTNYDRPIPEQGPIPGHSSGATAAPGQSYVSPDGNDWYDLATIKPNTNVCIKAFSAPLVGGRG